MRRLRRRDVKVELNLFNFVTNADLKNATGVDRSIFSNKADLASVKVEINKLDIDKLETTPVDLNKLSDVLKNQFLKNTVYDKLVKKDNAIQAVDASNLFIITDYDTKIGKFKNRLLIMRLLILLNQNLLINVRNLCKDSSTSKLTNLG